MSATSPAFGSHAKPRVRKPRLATRKTFAASYDGELLVPKRGAWTRSIDAVGDPVVDGQDKQALLVVNVGDQLILFGKRIEEDALVEVVAVERDGWAYRVRTLFQIDPVVAGEVFVMRRGAAKGRP